MKKIGAVLLLIIGSILPVVVSSPAHAVANCPAGSNTYGSTQCINAVASIANPDAVQVYNCPLGGTLSGSNCLTAGTPYAATATNSYYCNNDLYGAGQLQGTTCYYPQINGTPYQSGAGYYCPSGWSLSGSTCSINVLGMPTYSCLNNYSYDGNVGCYYNYYPYSYIGATVTQHYTTNTQAASYNSGTTITPVIRAAYSSGAPYSLSYSCPQGGTLSGTTCQPASTLYPASLSYTGFCPVNYSINTTTGNCDAVPYTPNAIQGPLAIPYNCTGYNLDGTYTNFASAEDLTFMGGYVHVVCQAGTLPTVSQGTGSYLCLTQYTSGLTNYLTSPTDITSWTTDYKTTCTYSGETPQDTGTDIPTWTSSLPDTNAYCDTSQGWDLYISCLSVSA